MCRSMSYLGLKTWEVISPNFHALTGCDRTDGPQVTRDLGLGTHVTQPSVAPSTSKKLYHASTSEDEVERWPAVTAEIFTYFLRY